MSEKITISNGVLEAVISTYGAELKSLKKYGEEYLWGGDPKVWSGQAPVLFPICGGLKNGKYIYEGSEYKLEKHGFARKSEFEIEKAEKTRATFLLKANEDTLKKYPFEFELRITYLLEEDEIKVSYAVTNIGNNSMYFSIGSHEAYDCPEGIEEYSVIFEHEEKFESSILDGELLEHNTILLGENTREFPLKYEYFAVDAQVFLNLKSRRAILKNRRTGKSIEVTYEDADYFLLWTKPNGRYICIEPWSGIPDFVDSDCDITHKIGIIKLGAGETSVKKHSIKL